MSKTNWIVVIILLLVVLYYGSQWYESTQPCPASNPAGLGSNCKPLLTGAETPQNPLGI